MSMNMRSVMVQFREDQITQLDAEAARSGLSRAQVVRNAVDQSLPIRYDQALADLYAAAYPDGSSGIDDWGSLDEWHAAAAMSRNQAPTETDDWS
jgi:hypothetical protein